MNWNGGSKRRTAELTKANQLLRQEVAERQRTEEELAIFRQFAEAAGQGFGISNLEGRILYANPALWRLVGENNPESMIGEHFWTYHPEEWREGLASTIIPTLDREGHWEGELDLHSRQGKLIPTFQHAFLIRNGSGRPVRQGVVITDITERKRAEEALQEANHKLTTTLERITDGFISLDREWRYTYVNQAAARLLGKSREELLGMMAAEMFLDTVPLTFYAEATRAVQENTPVHFEEFYPEPLNIWCECHIYPSAEGLTVYFRDVTERKQAEAALQESEQKYKSLAEACPDAVVMTDLEGQILFASQQVRELHGLQAAEALLGCSVFEQVIEEDRRRLAASVARVAELGVQKNIEYTALRRDGTTVPVETSAALIRDAAGQPRGTVAVIRDITERKRAEQTLAQFSAIVNSSQDAIIGGTLDGVITSWNPSAERLYGYTAAEAMGKSISLVAPADRSSEFLSLLAKIKQGEGISGLDTVRRRKNGTLLDVSVTLSPIRDTGGHVVGVSSIIQDISERKRAQEALRRSERRFRNYFDQGLIGMSIAGLDKRFLEVNDRLCEMMGYSREELLQHDWAELTHPDDLEPSVQLSNRLLAGQIEHFTLDKRFVRKDGSIVYTTIHIRAFRKDDGSIDHVVALTEDITARKQAEEALHRERRTLEHMLQASDHERQLIAYEIHDGLAQYLTGAIMQLEHAHHIQVERPTESATAYQAGLELLRESHFEARRLISGVRPPILDESGVVAAVAHLVYDIKAHKGPKVEFRSKVEFGRLAPVLENVIYRIAQEGLTNACKHSQSERVRVGLVQHGDHLRIVIRDQGVGFSPATVEEGRFGLEGIRERARLLGGRSVIDSTPGKGTRIIVDLPIVLRKEDTA